MSISPPFRATYRLQLNREFQFADAQKLLPYLEDLGISHLYLSPIFEARTGSDHGYDGVNPRRISRERGGEPQLIRLMRALERRRKEGRFPAGTILDIVPNHLAMSDENPYWMDALKYGRGSRYWPVFDVWDEPVVLPALARSLLEVLRSDELKIERRSSGWVITYFDQTFPIAPGTRLHQLLINILRQQHYRLEEWRNAIGHLNYRRFFDINHLIGIRVENRGVMHWSHSKLFSLVRRFPAIDGVRIDHIDGLLDPETYLRRLNSRISSIWVEKILADDEALPHGWPVEGTTGYDFSTLSTRIFANEAGHQKIHDFYLKSVDSRWESFADCVYESKYEMLHLLFEGEWDRYLQRVERYLDRYPREAPSASISAHHLRNALEELTLALKPYRLYPGSSDERVWLHDASESAIRRGKIKSLDALDWWVGFFLNSKEALPEKKYLLERWQQLSGPLTAKGLEDTALYRYFPLLSLNSVGGEPDWNYNTVLEFHAFNQERLKNHPLSLNASTTHDTKRDEDVQSRIHVLSEIPDQWIRFFQKWKSPEKSEVGTSFEYFLYQTLLGVWPLNGRPDAEFKKRMKDYFLKATREAKLQTNWLSPNSKYEEELTRFLDEVLDPRKNPNRRKELTQLAELTAFFGAFNSLSAIALKILAPGIPDFYQGTELWSYSLVDPDNRRPVDYSKRIQFARRARESKPQALFNDSLFKTWKTGEVKFRIIRELLKVRRRHDIWFERGKYLPLEIKGHRRNEVIAFARWSETEWVILAVPRFLASTIKPGSSLKLPKGYFKDTVLVLPTNAPRTWTQSLTQTPIEISENEIQLQDLFGGMPIGVVESGS